MAKASALTGQLVVQPIIEEVFPTVTWANQSGGTITNTNLRFFRVGNRLLINGYASFSGTFVGASVLGFSLAINGSAINITAGEAGVAQCQRQTTNLINDFLATSNGSVVNFFSSSTGLATANLIGSDLGSGASGKINAMYFDSMFVKISSWPDTYRAYGAGLVTGSTPGLIKAQTPQTALTVTSAQAGFAVTRAVGIAYCDINDVWRLKFNIVASISSASLQNVSMAITGVVFKSVIYQSISAYFGGSGAAGFQSAGVSAGANTLSINYAASLTGTTSIGASGDVELNAKPSWA